MALCVKDGRSAICGTRLWVVFAGRGGRQDCGRKLDGSAAAHSAREQADRLRPEPRSRGPACRNLMQPVVHALVLEWLELVDPCRISGRSAGGKWNLGAERPERGGFATRRMMHSG